MPKIICMVFLLLGLNQSLLAVTAKEGVIQKETSLYIIQINYPQQLKEPIAMEVMHAFLKEEQEAFLQEVQKAQKDPGQSIGKSGLYIDYKIPYNEHEAMSLVFNVSNFQGGAHPMNEVVTFNFIQGKRVTLEEIFKENSNYLEWLVKFSRQALAAKVPDKKWMREGTKSETQFYKKWYFTKDGLAIVFDTYQVAPYAYGPQTVIIPKARLSNLLNPESSKAIWGLS